MTTALYKKAISRIRFYSHFRFREPIVVLESDDWGMERTLGNTEALRPWGEPNEWAYDTLETPAEMTALFELLGGYRDGLGNPWRIVPNFIVQYPDYEKTMEDGFRKLHLRPVSDKKDRVTKWREGLQKGVFYPQYHGRLHYNLEILTADLQNDYPGARAIFQAGFNGSFDNLKGSNRHNHSEYHNWRTGKAYPVAFLESWIREGMQIFEDLFGFSSESTIAPHYIFSPNTAEAMRRCGIKYIQAANNQKYTGEDGRIFSHSFAMGSRYYNGLVALRRNVKFEPARGRKHWGVDAVLEKTKWYFQHHIPVVIDSHRINYTGRHFAEGMACLDELIRRIQPFRPLVLSSDELGEAIANQGVFRSRTTGQTVHLTPACFPMMGVVRNRMI